MTHAERGPASELVAQYLPELCALAERGPILDLACGSGRNALRCAEAGARAIGIDRDADALRALTREARERRLPLLGLRADLESGSEIPIVAGSCGAVLVFRFLYRPLAPAIQALLCPGGLLLYETFSVRQRALGYGPRNPAFLLEPGELPRLFPDLAPVRVWEGRSAGERPQELAQLVARRPARG